MHYNFDSTYKYKEKGCLKSQPPEKNHIEGTILLYLYTLLLCLLIITFLTEPQALLTATGWSSI